MSDVAPAKLIIRSEVRGRALHLGRDGNVYGCVRQTIIQSTDCGRTWKPVTQIPGRGIRRVLGTTRLGARLARYEVRACVQLEGGGFVASNRENVFFAKPGEAVMRPTRMDVGQQPLSPPMCVYAGPDNRVIWGEYDSRDRHGKPVRVFVSDDGGATHDVAYVFEGGSILHVHNFLFDARLDKYWILVGDKKHEPGIGLMSRDCREIEWVGRGSQVFRAVEVFDFGDRLVYGTDTELEPNRIVSLDKSSGKVREIQPIEGSCIYACRFGKYYAITTSVEPSGVNRSRMAALYLSTDGENWARVFQAEKDRWHPIYFQFGSIVLPRGESTDDTIVFSGQALAGLDGILATATWG